MLLPVIPVARDQGIEGVAGSGFPGAELVGLLVKPAGWRPPVGSLQSDFLYVSYPMGGMAGAWGGCVGLCPFQGFDWTKVLSHKSAQ